MVAFQNEGADYLTGSIEPGVSCPTYGTLTRVGGTEESPVGDGGFVLPLGTRSGEWYLSSFTVIDLGGGGSHTETYPPTAPYMVRVVDLTRIRSTSPEQYVGFQLLRGAGSCLGECKGQRLHADCAAIGEDHREGHAGCHAVWLERWQNGSWIKFTDTLMADARGTHHHRTPVISH